MLRILGALGCLSLFQTVAIAADASSAGQSSPAPWQSSVDVDTHMFAWNNTRGFAPNTAAAAGGGSQLQTALAIQTTGPRSDLWKVELGARSGWVWSSQTTPGFSGAATTLLDSSLSSTFTYLGMGAIQPYISLNANLPTGTATLYGRSVFARMDPDLVGVGTFGEGFNFGTTLGANLAVSEDFIIGGGLGYTWRGTYSRDGAAATPSTVISRITPGNVFTPNVSVVRRFGSLTLQFSGSVSAESATQLNGADAYQTGLRYLASTSGTYTFSDTWSVNSVVSYSHINRNQTRVVGLPALVTEAFNSNNDIIQATLDPRYKLGDWTMGPSLSFMWRNHNSWNPITTTFVPAKTRWALGGAFEYEWTKSFTLRGRAEHVWTNESIDPGLVVPALAGNGWMAEIGGLYKF